MCSVPRSSGSVPIKFYILYHPRSEQGKRIALRLLHRFVEPPLSGGLRVPVLFTPDLGSDLPPDPASLVSGEAKRSLVIVISDNMMTRRVDGGTGEQWTTFLEDLTRQAASMPDRLAVLPVALEERGFDLTERRHMIQALLPDGLAEAEAERRQISEISFYIATHGLRLLRGQTTENVPPGQMKAPVSLFLSHAKRDIADDKSDPVYQTLHTLSDLPVEHWFDSAKIGAGDAFSKAIESGIRDATIIVAFHTDHFDSRPWCRREVLTAKRLGAHLLIVSALEDEVPRQFPYLGNVPIVHWRNEDPDTDARRVIDRAVLEAFRLTHNRKVLEGLAEPEDIVLASAPEALTLAVTPQDTDKKARSFLYPDPPLDRDELAILTTLRTADSFGTPLSRIVGRMSGLKSLPVAVSVSTPDNLQELGMDVAHLRMLTDEIHLHLLLGGLSLIYGGALNADSSDPENFATRFFELARGYSPLAASLDSEIRPILNLPPWPLHEAYTEDDLALFGKIADLERGPVPDLPWDIADIFPETNEGWRFAATTPKRRYAWARGLDAARHRISDLAKASVIIGGKLTGFAGVVPGVLEEAYVALLSGKPLYLVGAFGGVGGTVIEQMFGDGAEVFLDESAGVPDLEQVLVLFAEHGGTPLNIIEMGKVFSEAGEKGSCAALNNGLTDTENAELFQSTDARRIAELVLTGLTRSV